MPGYDLIGMTYEGQPNYEQLTDALPTVSYLGQPAIPNDLIYHGGDWYVAHFMRDTDENGNTLVGTDMMLIRRWTGGAWTIDLWLRGYWGGTGRLASDGTNLYFVGARSATKLMENGDATPGVITTGAQPVFQSCSCLAPPDRPACGNLSLWMTYAFQRDGGGTWTLLGTDENGGGGSRTSQTGGYKLIDICASPAEPNALYIARYQYGYTFYSTYLFETQGRSDCSPHRVTEIMGFGSGRRFGTGQYLSTAPGDPQADDSITLDVSSPIERGRLVNDTGRPHFYYLDPADPQKLKVVAPLTSADQFPAPVRELNWNEVGDIGAAPSNLLGRFDVSPVYTDLDSREMRWIGTVWAGEVFPFARANQIKADLSADFEYIRGDVTLSNTNLSIPISLPNEYTKRAFRFDPIGKRHWAFAFDSFYNHGWLAVHLGNECGPYEWHQQGRSSDAVLNVLPLPAIYAHMDSDGLYCFATTKTPAGTGAIYRLDFCRGCYPCSGAPEGVYLNPSTHHQVTGDTGAGGPGPSGGEGVFGATATIG